jgi:hypothetical protein
MTLGLNVISAVVGQSPLDYLTPWHDLTRHLSSGESAANHAVAAATLTARIVWLVFLIPTAIAFVDALRRPEYLYPHSTGYSKTLWVIAIAAGFVFNFSWLVVLLYLFLVVLRARHQLAVSPGMDGKAASAKPPSRPFK